MHPDEDPVSLTSRLDLKGRCLFRDEELNLKCIFWSAISVVCMRGCRFLGENPEARRLLSWQAPRHLPRGKRAPRPFAPCSVCYRETYTVLKMCSFRWVLEQPRLRRASIDSLARASPRSSYKKEGIGSRSYNTYYFPLSTLPLFFLLLLLSRSLSSRFIYPTYTVKFTNSINKMPFSLSCSWE